MEQTNFFFEGDKLSLNTAMNVYLVEPGKMYPKPSGQVLPGGTKAELVSTRTNGDDTVKILLPEYYGVKVGRTVHYEVIVRSQDFSLLEPGIYHLKFNLLEQVALTLERNAAVMHKIYYKEGGGVKLSRFSLDTLSSEMPIFNELLVAAEVLERLYTKHRKSFTGRKELAILTVLTYMVRSIAYELKECEGSNMPYNSHYSELDFEELLLDQSHLLRNEIDWTYKCFLNPSYARQVQLNKK
jgi:hypothetical protein